MQENGEDRWHVRTDTWAPQTDPHRCGYRASPWHGTKDLWTVLRADGTYQLPKSVFWSSNFPGGVVEKRPEIAMTWHRLDTAEPPIVEEGPGTNAFTGEEGWLMIAGIDPDVRSCWKVTATYKGATLSYVANTSS